MRYGHRGLYGWFHIELPRGSLEVRAALFSRSGPRLYVSREAGFYVSLHAWLFTIAADWTVDELRDWKMGKAWTRRQDRA